MLYKNKAILLLAIFLVVFGLYSSYHAIPVTSWNQTNNYRNVSIRTTVNITDAMPEILNITCNANSPLTLTAGAISRLNCTVLIRDWNGASTIQGINGSGVNKSIIYFVNGTVGAGDADDNNTHYTNYSCTNGTISDTYNITWNCNFDVLYYANNGTWRINVTVNDTYRSRNYSVSNETTFSIDPLYALNVTNEINFGDMYVGETTGTPIQANVTNFGNMNINVSIYGYAGDTNAGANQSLAMVCTVRNITLANEKYALSSAPAFIAMTAISNSPTQFSGLTIAQQTNDSQQVINVTHWRLYVDPATNPFGICNGTVVFSAISST